MYGHEVILDLKNADISKFTRKNLSEFLNHLCNNILHVRPEARYFWDDENLPIDERQTDPKTKGTTVIQFLLTSSVTIHTLDLLKTVYINIFVCREFDTNTAIQYCQDFFIADTAKVTILERL